ncbi:hypothetical protein EZS27_017155 [termite gut metagenome]|uniref:Wadjet protein JetD C-terminal domain-containing protein n=1 Tax=termite gut metagenome TaxID=433724 RepID=A0A5J4RLK6_9ZZZZ
MISPNEIKNKAENKYNAYLQSIVEGVPFAEISIVGNKKPSDNFSTFQQELTKLIENSKENKGYGYTVKYQTIKKKNLGIQDIPIEIGFQTETDFLKYLHKEKEVVTFRTNIQRILSQFPELKEWTTKYPQKVIDNQGKWENILKVCNYFKINPVPNLYIRELAIQVYTKFIENNKAIIRELLDILITDFVKTEETNFEKRFNLKYNEPLVRFRILDKHISKTYFSGIDDLSIPISQFEHLQLPMKRVLVVENKTNLLTVALTIPELDETIVIFGSGYKVETLKSVTWFNSIELLYWGDIDAQGFEILSRFREYFPHVQSILMNKETFDRYSENDEGTPSKTTGTLNLTDDEQQLYEHLKTHNWRLEQEKISIAQVNQMIKDILK